MQPKSQKLQLKYPCKWRFKIIGTEVGLIEKAIIKCVPHNDRIVSFSRMSKRGTYCSLNLEVTVGDENERTVIYRTLKNHPDVKIVI